MRERNIERALLRSDQPFQIHSSGGLVTGTLITGAQLNELMQEICPLTSLTTLHDGGSFHFCHRSPFGEFDFGVESFVGSLAVTIAPAKSAVASAASPLPQVFAPATAAPVAALISSVKRELYVYKNNANVGPMTPEHARQQLDIGAFAPDDLAITPAHKDWDSLENVLRGFAAAPTLAPVAGVNFATVMPTLSAPSDLIRSFLNEEQDPTAVTRVVERLQQLCTPAETILYIAVQKKPVVTVAPTSVALTDKRVIIFRPKALGMGLSFQDYLWRTVIDMHISEAILGATLTVKLSDKPVALVDSLPKAQARKLYQFGQQMEEQMYSHRRDLMLEEKRAGAGGVNVSVNNAPSAPVAAMPVAPSASADDPVEKLRQLKAMLDHDLISQTEYDAKKTEIMARF